MLQCKCAGGELVIRAQHLQSADSGERESAPSLSLSLCVCVLNNHRCSTWFKSSHFYYQRRPHSTTWFIIFLFFSLSCFFDFCRPIGAFFSHKINPQQQQQQQASHFLTRVISTAAGRADSFTNSNGTTIKKKTFFTGSGASVSLNKKKKRPKQRDLFLFLTMKKKRAGWCTGTLVQTCSPWGVRQVGVQQQSGRLTQVVVGRSSHRQHLIYNCSTFSFFSFKRQQNTKFHLIYLFYFSSWKLCNHLICCLIEIELD